MKEHGKITVYGLFTFKGYCIYIGATIRPLQREQELRRGKHPKGIADWQWTFKPLLTCTAARAARKELEQIIRYKALGQAPLNRHFFGRPAKTKSVGTALRCKKSGMVFLTMSDAARFFNCPLSKIWRAVRNNKGRLQFEWGDPIMAVFEEVPELSWHPKLAKKQTRPAAELSNENRN